MSKSPRGARLALAGAVLLALAACQKPKAAKPVVVVAPALPLPPPAAPPAPPLPPPPALPPVATVWHFQATPAACRATAESPSAALDIASRPGRTIRFTVSGKPGVPLPLNDGTPVTIFFTGAGGSWQLAALVRNGAAVAVLPGSDRTLGDVLALLGGGDARLGNPHLGVPLMHVPPGGAPGRAWFVCARGSRLG